MDGWYTRPSHLLLAVFTLIKEKIQRQEQLRIEKELRARSIQQVSRPRVVTGSRKMCK